jgi:hypothetical protein
MSGSIEHSDHGRNTKSKVVQYVYRIDVAGFTSCEDLSGDSTSKFKTSQSKNSPRNKYICYLVLHKKDDRKLSGSLIGHPKFALSRFLKGKF